MNESGVSQAREMVEAIIPVLEQINEVLADLNKRFGYKLVPGLKTVSDEERKKAMDILIEVGGVDFSNEYMPFLFLMNGFDINGVRLHGVTDNAEDFNDIRMAEIRKISAPEFIDENLVNMVVVGQTGTDVIVYNKNEGIFELRDRIGTDTVYESFDSIKGVLQRLSEEIKP